MKIVETSIAHYLTHTHIYINKGNSSIGWKKITKKLKVNNKTINTIINVENLQTGEKTMNQKKSTM